MLALILLTGLISGDDPGPKPSERDVRAAHAMLAGTWQVVSVVDNGDRVGAELIRRKVVKDGQFRVGDRTITHVNPETGETRTTGFILNPLKSPRQIDLITPDERILKGIYRFDGDDLIVCYGNREESPRPEAFDSPTGSFRILITMKLGAEPKKPAGPADQPAEPTKADDQPSTPARTRTASLKTPSRAPVERQPTESELRRDRDLLGGNWRIESIEDDGERLAADLIRTKVAEDGVVRIGVRGMSIVSPRDDQKHLWAYRIDPTQTPRQIDVTTQFDAVLKGIYSFEGDRLLICVAKSEDSPRPTSFGAAGGSGRMLYKLSMLRDDPPPAKVEEPKPPPRPSAEDIARRREQQIRDMLVGSWSLTDRKGKLVAVFRPDGSFTATRTFARRRLFEADTITSNGSWSYGQGILSARVTGTTDRNMLGYGFAGRLQSIGDDALVTADRTGQLLTLTKVR
jgi:uncharacterized protein (TIGR03067 family)